MPSLIGLGAPSTRSFASFRPEAGDLADDLDHVDLVGADFRQRRGELGLLLDRRRRARRRAAARHRHRHRRRGRDAELLLELLHELRELEDRDALDVFDNLLLRQCHVRCSYDELPLPAESFQRGLRSFRYAAAPNASARCRPTRWLGLRRCSFLLLRLHQDAHQIPRHGIQHAHELNHRRLEQEQELRVELRLARQRGELGDFARLDGPALHHRRLDLQRRRGLRERREHLRERDRILAAVGDGGRADEELRQRLERRALERARASVFLTTL